MQIALLLLVGIALIGLNAWISTKLWPVSYSTRQIEALTEALYQVGYEDQTAGRPEKSFEPEGDLKLGKSQRAILDAGKSVYQRGRRDAIEGKPSITKEIQRNRNEQIRILNEMIETLKSISSRATAALH